MSRRAKQKDRAQAEQATARRSVDAMPRERRRSRAQVVGFVIVLAVLVVLGSVIELYMIRHQLGGSLRAAIAQVVGWCLGLLSVSVSVDGTAISVASAQIEVAVDCTGIRATAIFWAGVLAFPCSWRAKLVGLVIGLIGVGALNVLRIAVLGLIMGYRYAWFDPVHTVLMQGFLVVFVAPLWIVWMLRVIRSESYQRSAVSSQPSASG